MSPLGSRFRIQISLLEGIVLTESSQNLRPRYTDSRIHMDKVGSGEDVVRNHQSGQNTCRLLFEADEAVRPPRRRSAIARTIGTANQI